MFLNIGKIDNDFKKIHGNEFQVKISHMKFGLYLKKECIHNKNKLLITPSLFQN